MFHNQQHFPQQNLVIQSGKGGFSSNREVKNVLASLAAYSVIQNVPSSKDCSKSPRLIVQSLNFTLFTLYTTWFRSPLLRYSCTISLIFFDFKSYITLLGWFSLLYFSSFLISLISIMCFCQFFAQPFHMCSQSRTFSGKQLHIIRVDLCSFSMSESKIWWCSMDLEWLSTYTPTLHNKKQFSLSHIYRSANTLDESLYLGTWQFFTNT